MLRHRDHWVALPSPLQRWVIANVLSVGSVCFGLVVVELTGPAGADVDAYLVVLAVSWLCMLVGVALVNPYAAMGPISGMVAAIWVACIGFSWISPALAVPAMLGVLSPVLLSYPYLSRRAMGVLVGLLAVAGTAAAMVGEYRRAHATELVPAPWVAVLLAISCLPAAVLAAPGDRLSRRTYWLSATVLTLFALSASLTLRWWQPWLSVDHVSPGVLGVLVMLAVIPPLMLAVAKAIRDATEHLDAQADELRAAHVRLVTVADAARGSLERDLHDGAQQRLVALSVQLRRVSDLLEERRHNEAATVLAEASETTTEALHELRELARGIYPPLLSQRGLGPALQAACRRAAIPVTLELHDIPRLPATVEAAAYFCVLEALVNAAKHAHADEVFVRVVMAPGLIVEVRDEGVGFDPTRMGEQGGLVGIDARVKAVGGRLSIESTPGRGSLVRATFDDVRRVE